MPRVLLVEDETVNRELFRRRLERKGFVVLQAENGLSAVTLTRTEKPDLVVMDIGLPDIDGWEATRRLKADPTTAPIPVIVLSAHASTEARDKAFEAGCEEFESKPVNWDVLFKKIDEALARAKARAEELAREKARAEELARAKARPADPPVPDDEVDFGAAPEADPGAGTEVRRGSAKAEDKEVCAVQRKRVLVVEEDDANRAMLCRRLNRHGHSTAEAGDGRRALEAITRERFDLVMCDTQLPGVDGFEVLRWMKADPDFAAIPVIMVSASGDSARIARCIDLGAEDYIQKPFDPTLLLVRVNACLDKRRLRDQESSYLRGVADLIRAAEMMEKGTYDPAVLAVVADRDDALGTLARVFARMAFEMATRTNSTGS
jgi:CheY-like chemotaxis protein